MNKFLCKFPDNRSEDIRWGEIVYGLGEGDEDKGDLKLMVGEILDNVAVKAKDTELVDTHNSGEELHDEDLVFKRKDFV